MSEKSLAEWSIWAIMIWPAKADAGMVLGSLQYTFYDVWQT